MACTLEWHNMSVATWFTSVQCIGFTVLSSNGWADLLASRVSPFVGKKNHTIFAIFRIVCTRYVQQSVFACIFCLIGCDKITSWNYVKSYANYLFVSLWETDLYSSLNTGLFMHPHDLELCMIIAPLLLGMHCLKVNCNYCKSTNISVQENLANLARAVFSLN